MRGLLVVERIDWMGPAFAHRRKRMPSALSAGRDVRRYRGFDGHPWPDDGLLRGVPLEGGLASASDYQHIERYYAAMALHRRCDLLYLAHADDEPPALREFAFRGFDYGYYNSEYSVFSSIIHEVIFGSYPEMRQFARVLSESLLLPSLEAAGKLASTRARLVGAGADLERVGTFGAVAIYAPPFRDPK